MTQSYRPIEQLLPDRWQAGDVTLADGGTLHYLRTGNDKPPMVLIHGFQVDGRMWLRTALQLEADYDVMMPDVRGHGLSSAMPPHLNEDTLSDDIVALINALNLSTPPTVIGHSMGADIALRLATKTTTQRVILVDPALKNFLKSMPPMGDSLPNYMQPVVETIQKLSSLTHTDRMIAGKNLLPPGQGIANELDYVSFVEGQSRFNLGSYQHVAAMGYVVDRPDLIAQVDCPIVLLTARQMMMRPEEFDAAITLFQENWQHGIHIHFDDSGHFIPSDQFERFVDVIRNATL